LLNGLSLVVTRRLFRPERAQRGGKGHKKTRREKDQRAPQFGDFKEKQWHLFRLPLNKKVLDAAKKIL
jgi:hypothetical protein